MKALARTAKACVMLAFALVGQAQAFDFQGEKSLLAVTGDGERVRIGLVRFGPAQPSGHTFEVRMDHRVMRDHFLSMREFKCLPAAAEITCHVPYPYANPARVQVGQLAWLEHHLLFLYKRPADFGAKLWNGIIFRLQEMPTALIGNPQAIDLNQISAPPDVLDVAPYRPADREDFPAGARWVRQIVIE